MCVRWGRAYNGYTQTNGYTVGLVIERIVSSILGPAGIVGGECTTLSLHPQYQVEMPLSKAQNPQLHRNINGLPTAPGVCSWCVCVFTAVCVHFGWVKCRAQIPSMGHHTWPYVSSLSLLVFLTAVLDDISVLGSVVLFCEGSCFCRLQ